MGRFLLKRLFQTIIILILVNLFARKVSDTSLF